MNGRKLLGAAALGVAAPRPRLTKRYLLAAVVGAAAMAGGVAAANRHLPVQRHTPPHVVVVGDYGRGTPLAIEVAQCQAPYEGGEMVYTPRTDTWTCEQAAYGTGVQPAPSGATGGGVDGSDTQ